jgi:hypothetical protein
MVLRGNSLFLFLSMHTNGRLLAMVCHRVPCDGLTDDNMGPQDALLTEGYQDVQDKRVLTARAFHRLCRSTDPAILPVHASDVVLAHRTFSVTPHQPD